MPPPAFTITLRLIELCLRIGYEAYVIRTEHRGGTTTAHQRNAALPVIIGHQSIPLLCTRLISERFDY